MSQTYTLPQLPFALNGLEPILSRELVELHYQKHHAGYVTALNGLLAHLEKAEQAEDLSQQITLYGSIKFQGGGHINHSLYWENLQPQAQGGGVLPEGVLYDALMKEFTSIENFQKSFSAKACALQGSGWAWLGFNPERNRIDIETTANHDLLFATKGLLPLLCIDMWEHAFYLSYKNAKTEYMKAIWSLINWHTVQDRLFQWQKK